MTLKWNSDFEESTQWPNPVEIRRMATFTRRSGVTLTLSPTPVVVDPRDNHSHHLTGVSCVG